MRGTSAGVTPPVAVIDTNVVVSALLTGEPVSPTAVVLDDMLRGRFAYPLSLELLAEYREVLLRPRTRSFASRNTPKKGNRRSRYRRVFAR